MTNFADTYFKSGCNNFKIQQYEDAIDDLKLTLDIDPDYVAALYHLKYSLCALNKYAEALRIMDKVVKLDPNWDSYMMRAGIIESLGDIEGQKQDEDKAWAIGHDLWI